MSLNIDDTINIREPLKGEKVPEMRPATPPKISSVEEAVAALTRPHDRFINERFSDMAKKIQERRQDRAAAAADEAAVDTRTPEAKDEGSPPRYRKGGSNEQTNFSSVFQAQSATYHCVKPVARQYSAWKFTLCCRH